MNIVTKDFPVTAGDATDDAPYGSFDVILSAPTLDRDGEVIDSRAFEPLPDHITFDTDHSMTCDSVVGSGTPYYAEDGTLHVRGGFAADARSQTIRQKVTDGHIRTTSVTFMAAVREPDDAGIQHVKRAELLNGTFTPIPSNREAVVVTAKSIVAQDAAARIHAVSDVKEGRRNSATDAAAIQDMHDLTMTLGAVCAEVEKSAPAPDTKTEPAEDETKSADDSAEPAADEAAGPAEKSADELALARISEHAAALRFG